MLIKIIHFVFYLIGSHETLGPNANADTERIRTLVTVLDSLLASKGAVFLCFFSSGEMTLSSSRQSSIRFEKALRICLVVFRWSDTQNVQNVTKTISLLLLLLLSIWKNMKL